MNTVELTMVLETSSVAPTPHNIHQLTKKRAASMDIATKELLNDRKNPKNKKKTKRRGPRLTGVSKQRRLANARERTRVHTLNANIDRLKDIIPLFPDEKPSKTETIRIAALYISHMTELLNTTEKTTLDFDCCAFDDLTFPSFNFDPFSDAGELLDFFWCDPMQTDL